MDGWGGREENKRENNRAGGDRRLERQTHGENIMTDLICFL